MHLQLTDIKITIKTRLSHKGLDKGDVSGLVEVSRNAGGGKNIDFWEIISDIPVPCHDGGVGGWVSQRCDLILYLRPQKRLKPYDLAQVCALIWGNVGTIVTGILGQGSGT